MEKKDYKATLKKTEEGTYIICARYFYADDYIGPEFVEVNENLLDYLIEQKRYEKRKKERDYRKLAAFCFDDEAAAELCGIVIDSAEDEFLKRIQRIELYRALDKLTLENRRRFYLYYACGMKTEQIAKVEGVSHVSIVKSLQRTAEQLKHMLE